MTNSRSGFLLRNFLLPAGDFLFGQRMISRLNYLEKAQWSDPSLINSTQVENLKKLIMTSYNEVPFYKDIFDILSVTPDSIQNKEDLQKFPVIDKAMFRAGYPKLTTRKTGQRTYEAKTSGSTGQNFIVREDPFTAGWYRATLMLSLEWAGWSIGDPHLQTGITPNRSLDRKLKDLLMKCHYVSAYKLGDDQLYKVLDEIDRYNIKYLFGYPGSIYYLAQFAARNRWNKPLASIVTWGDMLYPQYRKVIENTFSTRVFDTYGCSEGFHIAAQCGHGDHYHIHDLDVIIEFLDDNDLPVNPGTPGHVVVTRLHPGPMPLIRYRVGDIAVPEIGICECGRGFSLLSSIQGRDTDIVFTPGGNRLIVHFFTGILEHFPEIDSFQVIQEKQGEIFLYLVPKTSISDHAKQQIISEMKKKGIDELKVNIELVSQIPISSAGKRRFIINRMGREKE